MKSFKKFLQEQAIWKDSLAMSGNGKNIIGFDINDKMQTKSYNFICKYMGYDFGCWYNFINGTNGVGLIYNFSKNGIIKAFLQLKYEDDIPINNKKTFSVVLAQKGDIPEKGMVRVIYDFILNNVNLLSDFSQTPDSAKIWVELSKKYKVYLFNIKTKEILDELKDLKLKDERVWNNNRDIRMLCVRN